MTDEDAEVALDWVLERSAGVYAGWTLCVSQGCLVVSGPQAGLVVAAAFARGLSAVRREQLTFGDDLSFPDAMLDESGFRRLVAADGRWGQARPMAYPMDPIANGSGAGADDGIGEGYGVLDSGFYPRTVHLPDGDFGFGGGRSDGEGHLSGQAQGSGWSDGEGSAIDWAVWIDGAGSMDGEGSDSGRGS